MGTWIRTQIAIYREKLERVTTFKYIEISGANNNFIIDGSTARRCIAIVTNERRASYVIPLNTS